MKKNSVHLFRLIFIIAFNYLYINSYSQETLFKNKLSLKIGGGIVNSGKGQTVSDMMLNPLLQFEADYEINKIVDIGIYAAYAPLMHRVDFPYNPITGLHEWYSADSTSSFVGGNGFYESSQAIYYGINSNIHILPMFLSGDIKLDLYATPKIGIAMEQYTTYNETAEIVWSKPFIEFGLGLGLRYFTGRHFGFFGEYSVGKYYNNNHSRFLAGIVLKF